MINDIIFTEELEDESIENLKVIEEDEESFNNIQDIELLYLKKKVRPKNLNLNEINDENIPSPLIAPKKIKKVRYISLNLNLEELYQQNLNLIVPMAPRNISHRDNLYSNLSPDSIRLLHK